MYVYIYRSTLQRREWDSWPYQLKTNKTWKQVNPNNPCDSFDIHIHDEPDNPDNPMAHVIFILMITPVWWYIGIMEYNLHEQQFRRAQARSKATPVVSADRVTVPVGSTPDLNINWYVYIYTYIYVIITLVSIVSIVYS